MQQRIGSTPSAAAPGSVRRKAVNLAGDGLVLTSQLTVEGAPLLIWPAVPGVSLIEWARAQRDFLEGQLLAGGAVLFRGFRMTETTQFEELMRVISQGDLLEYTIGSTPRSRVQGKVFTSTDYPADQQIPMHNEKSYSPHWPLKIGFFCLKAAESGGETPIADSRKVLRRLRPETVQRFETRKVMYVRNYGELGLSWQTVFQTDDRARLEQLCRESGILFEWKGDQLKTREICRAVAAHPVTGEKVWFNQAHLFHVSNLPIAVQESLRAGTKDEDLPRNAFYGDGSAIEPSVLEEIREAYRNETILFLWQEGDILVLDNMNMAHGRTSYRGARKVVVGMGQNHSPGPL